MLTFGRIFNWSKYFLSHRLLLQPDKRIFNFTSFTDRSIFDCLLPSDLDDHKHF